jgi:hypothetical protein
LVWSAALGKVSPLETYGLERLKQLAVPVRTVVDDVLDVDMVEVNVLDVKLDDVVLEFSTS